MEHRMPNLTQFSMDSHCCRVHECNSHVILPKTAHESGPSINQLLHSSCPSFVVFPELWRGDRDVHFKNEHSTVIYFSTLTCQGFGISYYILQTNFFWPKCGQHKSLSINRMLARQFGARFSISLLKIICFNYNHDLPELANGIGH